MGFIHHSLRVQTAISMAPSTLFKSCQGPTTKVHTGRSDRKSLTKRSNFKCALQCTEDWILFNLFHSSKKDSGHHCILDLRGLNQYLTVLLFKINSNALHKSRIMVHISGSKNKMPIFMFHCPENRPFLQFAFQAKPFSSRFYHSACH